MQGILKKSSFIFIALIMITVMTSMAGCANKKTEDVTPSPTKSASTSKENTASPAPTANKIDITKEVNLKMVLLGDRPKDADEVYAEINRILKQKVNATVEVINIPWSDFPLKYSLMFASGEDFDLAFAANWAGFATEAANGGFYELTPELLSTYAPVTYSKLREDQWSQMKVKGKVSMVPATYLSFDKLVSVVRGDLRKKYNIPEINTSEDLLKYWDAILQNEKGMVPFAPANTDTDWVRRIFSSHSNNIATLGVANLSFMYDVNATSGYANLQNNIATAEYLNDVKLMKEFQEKGYWPKSTLANKIYSTQSFIDGKAAFSITNFTNSNIVYTNMMNAHPEWEPELVDIQKSGPKVIQPLSIGGMAIHATTKNPERALMVLDLLRNDQELFDLTVYGIKGKHWEPVGDTGYKSLPASVDYPADGFCPWGWRTELYRNPEGSNAWWIEATKEYTQTGLTPLITLFVFDDSNVKNEIAAISNIVSTYGPLLDYGFSTDVEKDVKEYNDKIKAAGGDKLMAEYQKQLSEFIANYGK